MAHPGVKQNCDAFCFWPCSWPPPFRLQSLVDWAFQSGFIRCLPDRPDLRCRGKGADMPANAKQTSRREFLARFRAVSTTHSDQTDDVIRPPWAWHLDARCTGCGDCAPACPEGIIAFDGRNHPVIDFTKGECTFCGACSHACAEDVFDTTADTPWNLDITVAKTCFAENGIYCRSCGDVCPESAIRIAPQLGGRARVIVNEDACTGCGACLSACPADAISITPQKEHAHG